MKLKTKVWTNSLSIKEGGILVVPPEDNRGGKLEEAKLELTFLAKN